MILLKIIGLWVMGWVLAVIIIPPVPIAAYEHIVRYPGKHDRIYRLIIATAFVIFIIWGTDGAALEPITIW